MSALLARWRRTELELHHAQLIRKACPDTGPTPTHVPNRFDFPEPQSLRGIPAIGRGVTGAITGTVPHTIRRGWQT